jgi:protein-tyrosine phosphatase
MFNRILTVCVGNVCRSPMAAALLEARLASRSEPVTVESAGLAALVGHGADPMAIELLAEREIDLSGHRARQLNSILIRAFDLVLVMEEGHQRAVESIAPDSRGRVHRIGRWGEFDVPDPYRKGRASFEQALELIERGIGDFERRFWSRA